MKIFHHLALLAILGFGIAGNSFARTIIVTTFADLAPAIDGVCSLREALSVAQGSATIVDAACGGFGDPGADVISLSPGLYPILLTGPNSDDVWGDLDIKTEVSIVSSSGIATIEAAPGGMQIGGRVIEVHPGARVVLQNLVIAGGDEYLDGGGILNQGWLYLDNVKVIFNSSHSGGGGIASYSGSELYLVNSTVSDNLSTGVASLQFHGGGGIWMAAGARGAITRSTVSGNDANNIGGGILSFSAQASGGNLEVSNSTISSNSADSGGGIYHSGTTPILLDKTTISNNTATALGGGMVNLVAESLHLRSTTVAGNLTGSSAPDCSGTLYSEGYNIIGILESPCVLLDPLALSADQTGTTAFPVDPLLSALGDNGGPTETHDLLTGSPALDSGHPNTCTGTDQRGFPRPSGSACDIGATEFQYAASRYVVDNNADNGTDCTLRDAVQSVVSGTPVAGCVDMGSLGVDTIEFAPAVTGSIFLLSDLPTVARSLHLIGPGSGVLTIDGQGNFPSGLFVDSPGNIANVVVEGLAFQDGFSSTYGAAFHLASNETLELKNVLIDQNEASAGCVSVNGNLIVTDSTVSNCTGRGILVNNGTLDISGSTVSDNVSATKGGGVFLQSSTMMASNSVFSGNSAVEGGGGLYVDSGNLRIAIERSTFSGNMAGWGAGIHLLNGELSLVDSAITGNSSNDPTGSGGGILVNSTHANISMANSTISGNTAVSNGGGLAVPGGSADFSNVTITDNTADADADGTGHGGGIYAFTSINMRNSILSGNHDLNASGYAPDCYNSSIVSGGFNLVGSTSGCSGATWSGDDIFAAELLLLSLADNGGPTLTHAILPPGPAVDGADYIDGCLWDHDVNPGTGDVVLNWDQRARPRYTDGNDDTFAYCDVGAFEFDPVSDIGLWSASSTLGVILAGTGNGTVTSAPAGINCGADCYQLYTPSTLVTMTPTPEVYSYFSGWSGDADCVDGQVTTDEWLSCTATFTAVQYTLDVSLAGNGSGTVSSDVPGINCPGDCSEIYDAGTSVTLTPTADSGWLFTGWSGDEDCLDGQVSMNSNVSCTAWFSDAHRYTVTSSLDDGGAGCTLREAIQSIINGSPSGGCLPTGAVGTDTVDFAPAVSGSILLNADLPAIDLSMQILGPGSDILAIDGQGSHRSGPVLVFNSTSTVLVQGLTLRNGFGGGEAGAIFVLNNALELRDVKLINNQAGRGGAISVSTGGSLLVSHSMFSGNSATGGYPNGGGAIYLNNATLATDVTLFSSNTAPNWAGGAIWIDNTGGQSVTIKDSTFSGNSAQQSGAMEIIGGQIAISGSLFHNNSATAWSGGALLLSNTANVLEVSIANTTISGNSAVKRGGALAQNSGVLQLANVTVTDNTTNDTGGGGGMATWSGNGIVIRNSIISGNLAPNAGAGTTDMACINTGAVISQDYNLIGDTSACPLFTSGVNDLLGVAPALDSLADNGGATMTHRLLAGSPAIDGGNPDSGCSWDDDANAATADINLTTDQRGANRYADGDADTYNVCDRGAFEYNPTGDADNDGILDVNDSCINNLPISTGGVEYASAQTAYVAALAGDGVMKVQAGSFNMNLDMNQPGSILLTGSYSCDFSVQGQGNSVLGGTFTVGIGAGPVDLKVIGF